MQNMMSRVKTDADYEWEQINSQINEQNSFPENYKELYLKQMLDTCDKIKELYRTGALWELVKELYHMSDLFYGFRYKMTAFNGYAKKNGLETVQYSNADIPGSHNFNTYLNCIYGNEYYEWKGSERLLEGFYLPMVQVVRDFAKEEGNVPPSEGLVATRKKEEKNTKHIFSVWKVRYIKTIGLPDESELALPNYYNLGAEVKSPEEYHELFLKNIRDKEIAETDYEDFMKREYPVLLYIKNNLWEAAKIITVMRYCKK